MELFEIDIVESEGKFSNALKLSRLAKKLSGYEEFAEAYFKDIVFFSNLWNEHLEHLRTVFLKIREAGLTLKSNQYDFTNAEIDYLGHHIGQGKVQPREAKIEAIVNFPRPVNRKQMQTFLGLAGYYRKFVPHYSHLAANLSNLLKKNVRFQWTDGKLKLHFGILNPDLDLF